MIHDEPLLDQQATAASSVPGLGEARVLTYAEATGRPNAQLQEAIRRSKAHAVVDVAAAEEAAAVEAAYQQVQRATARFLLCSVQGPFKV